MAKIILVSFGGPRSLKEVRPFLRELLCDQEMVRTPLPRWLHCALFSCIANRRAPSLAKKYRLIGGKSPIAYDTEKLARGLSQDVLPFYRYLPATHSAFLEKLTAYSNEKELVAVTLYPQYSITTTGSAKQWIKHHAPPHLFSKIRWIDSYATHPAFVQGWVKQIRFLLEKEGIDEAHATLLFSAHSLPQSVIAQGDPYQTECTASYQAVAQAFPKAHTLLAYQSRPSRGRWLGPSTESICRTAPLRPHVLIIPIAFTTDHIETLYEIEYEYFPLLKERGLIPHRCSTPRLDLNQIISN